MNCTHPDIETSLKCSKCGKPICPKCMVQTPVGARCQDCARISQLPTYHVPTQYYLRAVGAALVMAIVSGAIWGAIEMAIHIFSFNLLLAPAAGYAIGEITSLAVNRKRSRCLAVVAGLAVVVSYLVTLFYPGGFPHGLFDILYHLLALGLGIFVAVTRLR